MSQFPVSTQDGVYQSLNYLLSGPSNSGQSIRGTSNNVATPLSENIVDQTTGQIVNSSPIVTNFLQPYLTDLQSRVGVTGGTDRVLLSAQLNNTYTYTTTADCTLQYTVFINRYRAQQNTNTTYNDFLFFFDATVASQEYTSSLSTTDGGLLTVTATGTKIAYTAPTSGSFYPAVDAVFVGVNATTGTGLNANIQVEIAYGAAGSYNNTNTKVTVNAAGELWTVGDTIVIDGADLGGVSGVNDLTLTVTGTSFGSGPSVTQETIFTNVVDEPGLGFYLYAVEVQWYALTGAINIDTSSLGVRSLSAQVLKQ
jgi:hypothetical protein